MATARIPLSFIARDPAVPAAAEGLPQVNRRSLLLGAVAASTAAGVTVVALPALAAGMPAQTGEPQQFAAAHASPELTALFSDLKNAVAEKAAATDAKEWLIDEWRHHWPLAPDEITLPGRTSKSDDTEVDLGGRPIVRPGETYARRVRGLDWLATSAANVEEFAEKARAEKERQKRQRAAARWRQEHRLGEEYYGQIERVKEASGISKANARIEAANVELYRIGERLMAIPSSSIACLAIKAEAVEIWFDTMFPLMKKETNFLGWSIIMARDIRTVAAEGAS